MTAVPATRSISLAALLFTALAVAFTSAALAQDSNSYSIFAPPPAVTVSISPSYAPTLVGQTLQFSATVAGSTNTAVNWQVNGVIGGNSSVGTITSSGLFTAPAAVPVPAIVNITAVSQASLTSSATATLTL